jgi:glycosyltransferase involved in cell wall biosynthesis
MKILWYAKNHAIGGDFIYSQEVVKTLRALGHEVYWLGYAAKVDLPALRIVQLPSRFLHPLFSIGYGSSRIRQTLKELKPDVVHANLAFSTDDFALIKICRQFKVPLVVTFHAPFNPNHSLWGILTQTSYLFYSKIFTSVSRVITFSQRQKDFFVRHGLAEEQVRVVFNGVDVEKYRPGEQSFKQALGAKLIVLYFGRVETGKNVESLVEAFQEMGLPKEIKLVIMGGGLAERSLRKKALGDENIVFTGFIKDQKQKLQIIQSGDIFVLPSEVEGMSISLLEAMSCGLAPVTSNIEANTTVTGEAGIHVNLSNLKEELKRALQSLIENPQKRKALGEAARERVKRFYSLENNVSRLVEIYQSLKERT